MTEATRRAALAGAAADDDAESYSAFAAAVSSRLATVMSARGARAAAASVSAFLTAAVIQGGLLFYLPQLQAAVLTGMAAGLVAGRRADAPICAFAAFVAAGVLVPGRYYFPTTDPLLVTALVGGLMCAAAALGVRLLAARWSRAAPALLAVAVALIVVNMWVTAIALDGTATADPATGQATAPLFSQLAGGQVPPAVLRSDDFVYLSTYRRVRAGEAYYPAFRASYQDVSPTRRQPASAVNYRLPTLFWLLTALPAAPVSIVALFLTLASGAVLSVWAIRRGSVVLPVIVPGCAALAAYFLTFATNLGVLYGEIWAACLGVLAVAAFAASGGSPRSRAWVVAAAALALTAAVTREAMAILLVAGLVSSIAGADRRFRAAAWGIALGAFAVAYGAHYLAVKPLLASGAAFVSTSRGLGNVVAGLRFGSFLFNEAQWIPLVLAVLGGLGIAAIARRELRILLVTQVGVLLFAFLFVGNGALEVSSGAAINYWGTLVNPFLYAALPAAFALLPGLAPRRARTAAGSRATVPARGTGRTSMRQGA